MLIGGTVHMFSDKLFYYYIELHIFAFVSITLDIWQINILFEIKCKRLNK